VSTTATTTLGTRVLAARLPIFRVARSRSLPAMSIVLATAPYSPDSLYATGGVLGLNGLTPSYNEFDSKSIFAEVQIPIISDANKLPFVKDLSIGLFARNEKHTVLA